MPAADETVSAPSFSPLDILPFPAAGLVGLADRPQAPALAGARRAAAARGLEAVGAKNFVPLEGWKLFNETVVAGGRLNETLFAGLRQSLAVGFAIGGLCAFGRLDGSVEYDVPPAGGGGIEAAELGAAAGIAGNQPLPWTAAGTAAYGLTDGNFEAGVAIEAGDILARWARLGVLNAAAQLGADMERTDEGPMSTDLYARTRLELEGRCYSGALARGIAAWADGEIRLDAVEGRGKTAIRVGVEAATHFGSFAGLSGATLFAAATEPDDTWADELRGLSLGRRPMESSLGLVLSIEGALLLARGTLFLDPRLGVEFFIKPFVDAAFLCPEGGETAFSDSIYATAGGELAMTIVGDRRQSLVLRGSMDLTGLLREDETGPSRGDSSLEFLFAFAF